jgi:small subunit ribosomal protein S8
MSLSDPIANMLTIIRNAVEVKKPTVDIPASKLSGEILEIFKKKSYIEDFRLMKNTAQGTYKIYLKYDNQNPVIRGMKRISKPSLRIYAQRKEIPRVLNGLGTAVLSTSKGVVDDQEARQLNVGGEVLCYIW